ncbi:MAG: hypothetical protein AW08_03015 [Candidatus Accumulibacter adjunctus]|uniref:Uncharacterized protein n=1 Tax=Candidatus Accumulibacter adjunctus TaxID=1454001 RepID=A0A011PHA4_9PROT|nr:MAG: hypothetical protein AW08_03015 [Candidatus Accumulibacter adjunctus]
MAHGGLIRPLGGTIVVPLRLETETPTTLTLKNIPDAVCEQLKLSAEAHRSPEA